jgi:ribose transport system substrate-binding protein
VFLKAVIVSAWPADDFGIQKIKKPARRANTATHLPTKKLNPMKRSLWFVLYISAGFAATLTIAHAAGKPTFAIVPKSISIAFYADVERGCKEEGDKLGVNVIYTGPDTADAAKQVQILQDLVSRGVSGFAVAPMDAESVIGVIDAALKKGIKVITFDSDSPKSGRIAFVGTNNYQAGVEAGKAFAANQPDGKFAVITGGLAAANHNERGAGFRDALKATGGKYTEIPGSPFPCNDDAAKSIQIIQDVLSRYPDLDGFFFSGGWPLFGAAEAYVRAVDVNHRIENLTVVSFDSLPEELALLKKSYVDALIGQRPYAMGVKSVDVLNDLVQGKKVPAVIDTGVDVINQEIVDQFIKQ